MTMPKPEPERDDGYTEHDVIYSAAGGWYQRSELSDVWHEFGDMRPVAASSIATPWVLVAPPKSEAEPEKPAARPVVLTLSTSSDQVLDTLGAFIAAVGPTGQALASLLAAATPTGGAGRGPRADTSTGTFDFPFSCRFGGCEEGFSTGFSTVGLLDGKVVCEACFKAATGT